MKSNIKQGYFITGTDTSVGKTYVSVALLNYFNKNNFRTAALKPIASGCTLTSGELHNEDALQLQATMSMPFSYQQVNPIALKAAIAPHLAALPHRLNVAETLASCRVLLNSDYDRLVIEGAGGWLTPLNERETFADLAAAFGYPIILVVGVRLGCINHTLLTWENIKNRQLPFAGWIANHIDPQMEQQMENLATLEAMMGMPPLAQINYLGSIRFI